MSCGKLFLRKFSLSQTLLSSNRFVILHIPPEVHRCGPCSAKRLGKFCPPLSSTVQRGPLGTWDEVISCSQSELRIIIVTSYCRPRNSVIPKSCSTASDDPSSICTLKRATSFSLYIFEG